jgi:predicted permease
MKQLTFALRMLLKTPVVSAVAILSLGLGIGANTAIFTMFNQVLMQPLPVARPAELVNLASPGPKSGSTSCNNSGDCDAVFSYPMYLDLVRDQHAFTGIVAHRLFVGNVGYDNSTLPVDGALVSGNYFDVLGLQPVRGRLIRTDDTAGPGGTAVVVLSHDYWTTRFASDPAIVGQSIVVNGQSLGVIGVAPRGFDGTTRGTRAKVFVPITMRGLMEPPFSGFEERNSYWAYLFARLKPGVAIDEARSSINVPYARILSQVELPLQRPGMTDAQKSEFTSKRITIEDGRRGQSSVFGQAPAPLTTLQIVTAIVLLIACGNVANLLLARAASRAGEMAVRLSIGASRAQLVRQLLLESCLLALIGGAAGLLIFKWTIGIMIANLPLGALDPAMAGVSATVLAFTSALSILTGVLFGIFPAFHATRPDLAMTLKGQSGRASGSKAAARFRTSLVIVQIALSMGLLACAGLFGKSLLNVSRIDLGVKVDRVVTFSLGPQRNGYTLPRSQELFQQVLERLSAVPGVDAVSASRIALIGGGSSSTGIDVQGFVPAANERTGTNYNETSPGFFRTVGMPLLAGRDFTDADVSTSPKVAIVNESFARRFKLGADPIGRRFRRGGTESSPYDIEIVGLVRDARYNRVRDAVPAVFFLPYRQNDRIGSLYFYARTQGDPDELVRQVRPLIASFDPNLPVLRLTTMPEQIASSVANDRLLSALSASFAGLATLLAAIGLFGVLAYTVSQRTREFGLRMALGAAPGKVQGLVLMQVMWMTLAGGAIGLGLAVFAGRYASTLLFEMNSTDPVVLAVSMTVLALVALAAGFVPSRRASRVDPMKALRAE